MQPQQQFQQFFRERLKKSIENDDFTYARNIIVHQIKLNPNIDKIGSEAVTRFIRNAIADTLIP